MQAQETASLRGTIRDVEGKALAGVSIQLRAQDAAPTQTAHTDLQGAYSFAALRGGIYALRAEIAGYGGAEMSALFFGPNERKTVDLTLQEAKPLGSPSTTAGKPEFFDQPQFVISGVTDTTSLGGHGSDTVVRTRETIAKQTVSLGKASSNAESVAAVKAERSLREDVQRDPGSFDANHRLGKFLAENGKAHEALPYLERAAELKPGDYENSYDLALANDAVGNYDLARHSAQALLAYYDKADADVHHLLANVQEQLGDSLEAVREYQRAAELEPSEPYIFDWGSELLLHHAPEPALDVFANGNRLFPRSVRMLIGLGAAWFARGSYDEAVQRVCEASDLSPSDFDSVPVPRKNASRAIRTLGEERRKVAPFRDAATRQCGGELLLRGWSMEAAAEVAGRSRRGAGRVSPQETRFVSIRSSPPPTFTWDSSLGAER